METRADGVSGERRHGHCGRCLGVLGTQPAQFRAAGVTVDTVRVPMGLERADRGLKRRGWLVLPCT